MFLWVDWILLDIIYIQSLLDTHGTHFIYVIVPVHVFIIPHAKIFIFRCLFTGSISYINSNIYSVSKLLEMYLSNSLFLFALHLFSLNQFVALFLSTWRFSHTSTDVLAENNNTVSSAYRAMLQFVIHFGRSFFNIIKSRGHKYASLWHTMSYWKGIRQDTSVADLLHVFTEIVP